jgi:hypothetical protein
MAYGLSKRFIMQGSARSEQSQGAKVDSKVKRDITAIGPSRRSGVSDRAAIER